MLHEEDKTKEVKSLAAQDELKKQNYLNEQKEIQQEKEEKENDVQDMIKKV